MLARVPLRSRGKTTRTELSSEPLQRPKWKGPGEGKEQILESLSGRTQPEAGGWGLQRDCPPCTEPAMLTAGGDPTSSRGTAPNSPSAVGFLRDPSFPLQSSLNHSLALTKSSLRRQPGTSQKCPVPPGSRDRELPISNATVFGPPGSANAVHSEDNPCISGCGEHFPEPISAHLHLSCAEEGTVAWRPREAVQQPRSPWVFTQPQLRAASAAAAVSMGRAQ